MGMDVYGNNPVSERGEYFRNNVWWWHPLWDYCENVFPKCQEIGGHWNDGDGFDEDEARELAAVLFEKLATGDVARYAAERKSALDSLPDEPCKICSGTGQRPDGLHGIEWTKEGCNGCEGKGTVRPFGTWYYFTEENVQEFAEFCAESGGFSIC